MMPSEPSETQRPPEDQPGDSACRPVPALRGGGTNAQPNAPYPQPNAPYPGVSKVTSLPRGALHSVPESEEGTETFRSVDKQASQSSSSPAPDDTASIDDVDGMPRLTISALLGGRPRPQKRGKDTHVMVTQYPRQTPRTSRSESDVSESSEPTRVDRRARLNLNNRAKQEQAVPKNDAVGKFRVVVKVAIFCARTCQAHILRNKTYDDISPYISSLHFHDYAAIFECADLLFDPSKFKADRQMRLPEDARRVLLVPPGDRTNRDIYSTQIALRNIKSFSEYPVRMQRKIVEVGRYQRYEAKRVIVRQYHPASAFYFILSGSVVIMVSEGQTKVAKPVAFLYKGMAFGELAIINRTTRQSTVIAKTPLEMLSIDIEDYHQIFMAGGVRNINDPDHNNFIKSLSFLRGWPIEKMAEEPKDCIFHYFKLGEIMMKDSRHNDWIFIVKSGSVRVLKKLRRVTPHRTRKQTDPLSPPLRQNHRSSEGIEESAADVHARKLRERKWILSDINIPVRSPESATSHDSLSLPEVQPTAKQTRSMRTAVTCDDTSCKELKGKLLPDIGGAPCSNSFKRIHSWISSNSKDKSLITRIETASSRSTADVLQIRLEEAGDGDEATECAAGDGDGDADAKTRLSCNVTHKITNTGDNKSNKSARKQMRMRRKRKTNTDHKASEREEENREMQGRQQKVRTILDDLDAARHFEDAAGKTEADLDPQFVNVQTLVKGQVFGVSDVVLGRQPSFCVVSNGAECIMIRKSFYLRFATESLLQAMRVECCPYPSDEDMQEELQVTVNWKAFKQHNFHDTLRALKSRSPRGTRV